MGGAQFFWRVTLLEGSDEEGVYRLEEHSIPKGAPMPENVPYREKQPRMPYPQLIDALFGCVRDEACQRISELSRESPQFELYHDHHSAI